MKINSKFWSPLAASILLLAVSCSNEKEMEEEDVKTTFTGEKNEIKLLTLDPGHFHAHLVKKSMYEQVDPKVHVYAPDGPELQAYLQAIENYNTRPEDPTSWELEVYKGEDFLQRMLEEKRGNVMVTAGNNREKTANIKATVEAGLHVLADKPMAIDVAGFEMLKEAFDLAKKNDVLLFDIMTERFEISTILQREFSRIPEVFGELVQGSLEDPAITKESVHHFYKQVSGSPLIRPAWFYDVTQQGNGIVDVTTHLVDLVQWESFPEQIIDYENDIELINARRWTTDLTLEQFTRSTGLASYPDYLGGVVDDGILKVYGNGEINYTINDVHAKVSVIWNYVAPEGSADTHYSIMRGSKSNLVIRQDEAENYITELYIEPVAGVDLADFEETLQEQVEKLSVRYNGLGLVKVSGENAWRIEIPQAYRTSHEDHFREVTERYIEYLTAGKLPDWEVPNMLAKYYVTTKALEMAQ
ncbi:Oxidoreductase family, NAD-binding Rossmann fold [Cyclobacterium lianum]|uniref:Oxidoreductase family, NAD-binding Rossmann fold n=2 Tax=Cyclobacterium lianum TaxID=388280 RepID=A0A1M7PFT0_9BACT|nr:Oxidoreductase family, NAD-binding Rossmann fold [Cyclobacterium lianum]